MQATATTIESLLEEGISAARAGRKTQAKAIFLRITRQEPSQDSGWFWAASVADSLQMKLSYVTKALDLNPKNEEALRLFADTKTQFVRALIEQGTLAAKNGLPEHASQLLLHAAELAPSNETVWSTLAELSDAPEDEFIIASQSEPEATIVEETAFEKAAFEETVDEETVVEEIVFDQAIFEETPAEIPLVLELEEREPIVQEVEQTLELESPSPELPTTLLPEHLPTQPPDLPPSAPVALFERPPAHLPSPTESVATFEPFTKCPLCEQELEAGSEQCPRCGGQVVLKNFLTPGNGTTKIKFDRRRSLLAVARYGQALTKDPENAQVHYNLALAYLNLNSLDVAMRSLRRAEQLRPDSALAATIAELAKVQLQGPSAGTADSQSTAQTSTNSTGTAGKEQAPTQPKPAPGQKSILVVDDSPTIRKLVAHTLGKSGYRVVQAVDGNDALVKVGEDRFDLVFLDIVMPNLDGYQVCKLIREKKSDLPVVMLSGRDGFFDKMRGKVAGSTAHITKPFDAETLTQAARKYCTA